MKYQRARSPVRANEPAALNHRHADEAAVGVGRGRNAHTDRDDQSGKTYTKSTPILHVGVPPDADRANEIIGVKKLIGSTIVVAQLRAKRKNLL
jgi:hypothetical protein